MAFKNILNIITERILSDDSDPFYTAKEITKPTDVIPWENNATQFDERSDTQPIRPYVAVDFNDIPLRQAEGLKTGLTSFTVKVVVDNFHRGRSRSEDRADYLNVLSTVEGIEELLDNYQSVRTMGLGKPIYSKNLIIFTINMQYEVRTKRSWQPWKATV